MALVYSLPCFLLVAGIITSVPGVLACFFIMGFGMTGLGMTTMHDANRGFTNFDGHDEDIAPPGILRF